MKKYVNVGETQAVIEFEDGSAQFLQRGQSIQTAKKVKKIRGNVKETETGRQISKKQEKS